MVLSTSSATEALLDLVAVPSMALGGTGSGAYAAVTGLADNGLLYSVGTASPLYSETGSNVILGVASHANTAYFTAGGAMGALDVMENVSGAMTNTLYTGAMAMGPVAADSDGVYRPTLTGLLMGIDLNGTNAHAAALQGGGGRLRDRVRRGGLPLLDRPERRRLPRRERRGRRGRDDPQNLSTGTSTNPAYGIAVDAQGSNVYFAKDDSVYHAAFPSWTPSLVASGLGHPHGVALDGNGALLYVADHGTPPTADGRILTVTVP